MLTEATCRHTLTDDQLIMTGWEDVIAMIAKRITEEQSPRQYVSSMDFVGLEFNY